MAITLKNYDGMLEFMLNCNVGDIPKKFLKEFRKFLRMASYLEDINAEAHQICDDYRRMVLLGYCPRLI